MVKMIAVDMDGTFLNEQQEYDKQRFTELFQQMKKDEIHFVVASGNRHEKLLTYFNDLRSEVSFVADNGGDIIIHDQPYLQSGIDREAYEGFWSEMPLEIMTRFVVSSSEGVFIHEKMPPEIHDTFVPYMPSIQVIDDFRKVPGVIFKPTGKFELATLDESFETIIRPAMAHYPLHAAPSGFGFVDILPDGVNKGSGLTHLMEHWSIDTDEVAAFGDNMNDFEMISLVAPYSFAMGNSVEPLKKAADHVIGDNNSSAVLDTIEKLINNKI